MRMVTSDAGGRYTLVLDRATRDKVEFLAAREDRPVSSWIRLAIRERIERQTAED
jgi:predicted transcriptional regulator